MKKLIFPLFLFLIAFNFAFSQELIQPYNLDFETGTLGETPPGWSISGFSIEDGYFMKLTDSIPLTGRYCVEIGNYQKLKPEMRCQVTQKVTAYTFRNLNFRFSGAIRTSIQNDSSYALLWVEIRDKLGGSLGFYKSTEKFQGNSDWKFTELTGTIDKNSETISFGVIFFGIGTIWLDALNFTTFTYNEPDYEPPKPLDDNSLNNLISFAKLYGLARYFQPTTEAQSLDWTKLALYGVKKVSTDKTENDLKNTLQDIFEPIAPNLKIFSANNENNLCLFEPPKNSLKNVALSWIYYGPRDETEHSFFTSKIINVFHPLRESEGAVMQVIDASPIKGKHVVMSVASRVDRKDSSAQAQLWLKCDDINNKVLNKVMNNLNPILSDKWDVYELEMDIPNDAFFIEIGLVLLGEGDAQFDNVTFKSSDKNGTDTSFAVNNNDFETGLPNEILRGWKLDNNSVQANYKAALTNQNPYQGEQSLMISSGEKSRIFAPLPGETFNIDLTGNLKACLPLSIYCDTIRTLPVPKDKPMNDKIIPSEYMITGKDRSSRFASVIILWNFLRHFAYTQSSSEVWDNALIQTLRKSAIDKDDKDFIQTLEKLVANVDDSQTRIWGSKDEIHYGLPFLWKLINNKVYITSTIDTKSGIEPGDIVISINSIPMDSILHTQRQRIAGSTIEWKNLRALAEIRSGDKNSKVNLGIQKRNGKTIVIELERYVLLDALSEQRPERYTRFSPQLAYFDLTQIDDRTLKDYITNLGSVKYIIFDLRGLAQVAEYFLGFFSEKPLKSIDWNIPIFPRPMQQNVGQKVIPSIIKPKNHQFNSEIYFLIDERTCGYGEAIAAIAKYYHIGKLIGTPTAGSGAEFFAMSFPGGYNLSMSGIFAHLPDGSSIFGHPVEPDILIKPDIEQIIQNKDQWLDKAMEIVNKK